MHNCMLAGSASQTGVLAAGNGAPDNGPFDKEALMNSSDDRFVFVEHMLAEHRRLEQLIRRTLVAFPAGPLADNAQWREPVVEGLVSLRDELAHHFREEESGGCLEEAAARCPHLSTEVQEATANQARLLEPLNELIDRCQSVSCRTATQAKALAQEFRQVVCELRVHEALECQIIQQGFSVCLPGDELPVRPSPSGSRVI